MTTEIITLKVKNKIEQEALRLVLFQGVINIPPEMLKEFYIRNYGEIDINDYPIFSFNVEVEK